MRNRWKGLKSWEKTAVVITLPITVPLAIISLAGLAVGAGVVIGLDTIFGGYN